MIGTRVRKILSDVSARRARTILVSASIFVGVLGVIALFTTRDLINRQLTEDIQEADLSMIDVQVSASEDAELDNDLYIATLNQQNEAGRNLAALNGVEVVEGQAFYPISFKQGDTFIDAELRAYSTTLDAVQIEPMRLVEGDWPQVGQNQVAVEQRFAAQNDFAIGDEVVLQAVQDGRQTEVTYTITGLVFHPYIFKGLTGEFPGPEEGIYAEYADAQSLLEFNGFSKFLARYETFELAEENYVGFQNALLGVSPYVPIFPTFEDPADNTQVENASIFNNILTALAFVTMIVSGFLVINVVSTIVFEQKRQIGAMKAIGASGADNFIMYAGIALVYGIIGTTLAVIPGVIVGYFVTQFLAPQLDILVQGFQWSPNAVLIGVLLGVLVPVIASALPVYSGVRVRIIDAITDLGISGDYGEGVVSRFIGGLPLPISIKQGISNVYQKRSRLLLTILTLTLTVATFMATISITIVLNSELDALFDRLLYEFEVTPNQLQPRDEMEQILLDIDEVDRISPGSIFFIQLEGEYVNFFTRNNLVQVFGIDPEGQVAQYVYAEGEGWSQDPEREGIVVSIAVATQLGLQVGDEVAFRVGGQRVTRELIGIERNGFDATYLLWEDLADLAGSVAGVPRPNEYTVLARLEDRALPVFAAGMDEVLLTFLVDTEADDEPGVVVSSSLAEAQEISEGDSITVNIDGEAGERRVDAIIPNEVLVTQAQQLLPQVETIPADVILFGFNDLVSLTGVSTEGDPVPNAYYVAVNADNPDSGEVEQIIDVIDGHLLDEGVASRFVNRVAFAENLNEIVVTNTSIIGTASALIAAVGAIGLLTTLSITVLERQKEIGVLRSIGAGSGAIAGQFLIEGLIIGFIAWVLSIVPSYYLAEALFGIFQLEYVPFNYPPAALVAGLIGILLVAAVSSLGPSLSAANKTVSDILRYQ